MSTGIVLAGGHLHSFDEEGPNTIVGEASPLQQVLDVLASVVDDVVITTGPDEPLPLVRSELSIVVCEDLLPERGPLTGILTGLQCARSDYALVVPCDTPFIEPALLRDLLASRHGYDATVPVVGGRIRPLPGVFRKTCIPMLERALNSDDLSVVAFLRTVRARLIDEQRVREKDPALRSFKNVRPRDVSKASSPS